MARGAIGSTLLLMGSLWFSGMLPVGRTATASTVGVAQSFGAQNASSGSATLVASPSAATTAGDLLVAVIRDRNTTVLAPVISVTDSTGETWSHAASVTQGTQAHGEIWYMATAANLSTSQAVTVTVGGTSASTSAIAFTVLDVTGASTTPLDVTATKGGNTQPAATGTTATTAQASEIAIGDIGWNGNSTASVQTANYTVLPTQQSTVNNTAAGEQAAWQLLSATGAQSYSATLSSSTTAWTGAIATFEVGGTSSTPTPTATATPTPTVTPTPTPPPNAPHIMVIVEENHSYNGTHGVIGNSKAPYINGLATTYMSATNWYGQVHGSPPDYQALIAGEMLGSITKPSSLPTLVDELASAGISWKAYMETMPSACDLAATNDNFGYLSDHNPFLYYASTRTPSQCQNVVPYTQFSSDANSSTPPDFMFMVPNGCNDMHTECPAGSNTQISNGDTWLKNNLPLIQGSTWYQQGGTVIITWDEAYTTDSTGFNGSTGGHIPTIVVSAATKAGSTHTFSSGGNLYGILRGIEERYGVPLLANTATAGNGDLSGAFGGQATSNLLSLEDASFEGGTIGGWGAYPSGQTTLANSTAQAADGTHSLLATATTTTPDVLSPLVPVVAGQQYTALGSMMNGTLGAVTMGVYITWYNASSGWLADAHANFTTSSSWQQASVTATAPAGAVRAGFEFWTTAASVGNTFYIDKVQIALGTSTTWTP